MDKKGLIHALFSFCVNCFTLGIEQLFVFRCALILEYWPVVVAPPLAKLAKTKETFKFVQPVSGGSKSCLLTNVMYMYHLRSTPRRDRLKLGQYGGLKNRPVFKICRGRFCEKFRNISKRPKGKGAFVLGKPFRGSDIAC